MKNFTLCVLLFCAQFIQAQMSVTTVQTPAQLVQDVLVGEGVTPFNITFNGAPATAVRLQAGHFTTNFNPTNLGIMEGMILATGNSRDAPGPNTGGGHTSTGGNIQINDVDLDILTTNTVTNVTVVEFDFVATGLELNFDYIFASEEYPEYVFDPGGYNDVFGFFLRGPGITGPFTGNARNLAVVPSTTTPITVNTINNGYQNNGVGAVNPGLYNPNTVTPTNGTTWTGHTVEYDGFTDVLRASAALICGETYHIKLAIANCGDQGWDSAVFLKNFRIKPFELLGNSGIGGTTGSGIPICPGEQVVIASGIVDQSFTYDWSENGIPIPGPHGPDLTVPASNGPAAVTAGSLVTGSRYQILSTGTTDFSLVGAVDNLPNEIFTATGPGTGDGVVAPVAVYELKYYTSSGCFLGSDTYDLVYVNFGLNEITSIDKCFPESTAVPPQYSFGNLNTDITSFMLNGLPASDFDIRYFDNPTDAYAIVPPAGISQAQLSNYTINSTNQILYIRFESMSIGCIFVKQVELRVDIKPDGSFSYAGPYCINPSAAPVMPTLSNLTPGGTFNPSSAGLIVNPTTGEIDLALSSPGNYTVNYHIPASFACAVFDVDKPVVITAAMLAPTVTSPITYCQGEVATPLSVSGPGLMWYNLPVGGTGSPAAPTPDTATSGTTVYYVSQNGGCESPRSAITVNVNAKPLPPTFTPVAPYCQNQAALPLAPSGSNLLWYTTATGGTGSTATPTPATSTPGITHYYVTQTVNGCESDRAVMDVEVIALPSAPVVTSPVTYCQNVTASQLTTVSGSNLLWYAAATGGVGNSTAPTPVTGAVGSTAYYVSQTVNGCEGPRALITVNVTGIPAAPSVISPLVYCQYESALPLSAVGSNLLWYTSATGGTGSAATPAPDTSIGGVFTYYVSQTIGCESPRSAITVTVNAKPLPPAFTPVAPYCQNQTALPLAPTGSNLLWYTTATGGTGSAATPTPATGTAGITHYYVTQTVNGCESDRAVMDVEVIALPSAPGVNSPVVYCQNTSASPLATTNGSNLLWYAAATGGTGNSTAPTPVTGAVGNTTYYVSQTVNGCEGPRASITVSVTGIPAAPSVTSPLVYCQNEVALPLSAVGSNLLWYTSATGGTGSAAIPTPNTSSAGSTTYYVSQTIGCEGPRSAIVINVIPTPAMPNVAPVVYCQNETALPLTAVGANLLWYTAATGGTGSSSAPPVSTSIAAVTNYYVTQTVNGCESARAQLVVTVNPLPAAPTANRIQPTCTAPTGTIDITAPTGANFEYSINSGATYQSATSFAGLAPNANYQVIVRNTVTGCVSASTTFNIQIAPTFPATPAVTGSAVCVGEQISLTTPAVAGATYSWTGPNGFTSSVQNPVIANSTMAMAGTYSLVISTTADCPSNPGTVNIVVNPLPQPVLAQDGYICFNAITNVGSPYVLNSGLDNATYDFEWFNSVGGAFTPIALETQNTYAVTVPGAYAVQATHAVTGCVSPMVTTNVGMSSPPLQVVAVSSEYFADIQSITINVSPPGNYEYQLDNGAFQTGNMFSDILPGTHTVTVRNECGELSTSAYLMDYPRFFTPNGDGYNDTWNIFALSTQAKAKIYIFDRYGKLIKQISPGGTGWDGTLNENILPSTDYWFTVEYEENSVRKEFKSHFALKR